MDPEPLEDEMANLFTVHILGNAEKPLSPDEIFERIMKMPREERIAVIHHYLKENA